MARKLGCVTCLLVVAAATACGSGTDGGDDVRGDAVVFPDRGGPTDPGGKDQAKESSDPSGDPAADPTDQDAEVSQPPDEGQDPGQDPAPDPSPDPSPDPTPDPTPDPQPDPAPDPTPDPAKDEAGGQEIYQPKQGSCAWFYECANECPDPPTTTCVMACHNALSMAAQDQQTALETCLSDNSCFGLPDAEFSVCLDTNCKDPFLACFAGDRIYTCVELNECIRGCPDNDDACVQNCFNMSGYLANWDWEKRVGCFRAECPVCLLAAPTTAQQQECRRCAEKAIFGACAVEYQRCWTAGNAKCAEMWDCAQACPDEVACVNACRDAATFAAQGKFQAVYTCADEQCPGLSGQAWADCATESVNGAGACVPALTACMDDADECATHCAPADGCGADGCGGSCGSCSGGKDCSGATATCS